MFVLRPVVLGSFEPIGTCECCGLGAATAARVWFDWPPDAHFDACWLCAELITAQAMIGVALTLAAGKGCSS